MSGGMGNMPGLANGLMNGQGGMQMRHFAAGGSPDSNGGPLPQIDWPRGAGTPDATNGPSMAYGGFARGGGGQGFGGPNALLARGQLEQVMQGTPGSTAAGVEGLINSLVPGRTDQLPMDVPDGSYVIPADVIAAMGQGNTMSGAKLLEDLFTGPANPRQIQGLGLASGGAAKRQPVSVMVAGGEMLVPPRVIAMLGHRELKGKGSADQKLSAGHKALDRMVLMVRAQNIKHLKKLPGPKK